MSNDPSGNFCILFLLGTFEVCDFVRSLKYCFFRLLPKQHSKVGNDT